MATFDGAGAKLGLVVGGICIESIAIYIQRNEVLNLDNETGSGGRKGRNQSETSELLKLKLRFETTDKDGDPVMTYRDAYTYEPIAAAGEYIVDLRVKGHPDKEEVKLFVTKIREFPKNV